MAQPAQPNPSLVCIFRKHLLGEFGQHPDSDPWWWPVAPGEAHADWGLQTKGDVQLASLRIARDGRQYGGFLGSVGAQPRGTWVVSTRPSPEKSFPVAVGTLHACLSNADLLAEAHVTDLSKFRGPGPDSRKNEGMTPFMWESSVRCLFDEYRLLQPRCILITKGAKRWFRERRSLINPASDMRREWREDPERQHLDTFLNELQNHPNLEPVRHWRASNAAGEWRSVVQRLYFVARPLYGRPSDCSG